MTAVQKIDSNSTGLRIALESGLAVLPGAPVWKAAEPNSYKDFGAEYTKTARKPISASRQQKKGVTTDRDASGGFQNDLTYLSLQDYVEGLMFASFRAKNDLAVPSVDAAAGYQPAAGGNGYKAGDIVFGSGFANPANNGPHTVTGAPGASSVKFAGMATDASAGRISRVGVAFAQGDIGIDATGPLPVLTSTAFDFTSLSLIPGEWVFIGGDAAGSFLSSPADNGFARVKSIAPHAIVLDKTMSAMVTNAGAGQSIVMYFGRVVKNESDPTLITRRTYSMERTLGAPDDANAAVQAEYLDGNGMNECVLTLNTADKITYEMTTVASKYDTRTAAQGLRVGSRPAAPGGDAYNTTDHVKRSKLSIVGQQSALYGHLSVAALTVNNNIKPNKAIGVLGGFDFSAGNFSVSATTTAYFTDVAAADAIRNNADCSFDVVLAADNQGIVFDCPLVDLGNGRLNVSANEAITIPVTMTAASGSQVDPNMDHTLMIVFFDYLPNRAM